MKKIFKLTTTTLIALFALFMLVGCGKITQKYADEINEKAEAGENLTYEEIADKLGEPALDIRAFGSGAVTWIEGVDSKEFADMMQESIRNGNDEAFKDIKGKGSIVVTFVGSKATAAVFQEYEPEK